MEKKIKKKSDKVDEHVSVITEAAVINGVYRYVITSNKNLKLGLCNISN